MPFFCSLASTYKPLNFSRREIRLIQIEPACDSSQDIECRLLIVSLDDKPVFHALSYVWGDPTVTELIYLDDEEFLVTTNLHAALRQVRGKKDAIIFWVDAISIDQSEIRERSSQVSMMGTIYSSAQLVHAWLGEANEESDAAIEIIENWTVKMDKPWTEVEKPFEYVTQIFREDEERLKATLVQACSGTIFEPLTSFLARPYWRRIWTVQELVLSSNATILCGNKEVSIHKIFYFKSVWASLRILSDYAGWIGTDRFPPLPLPTPPALLVAGNHETELLKLLSYCRGCDSTDPRDKLYGILGMSSSMGGLTPDYAKPTAQVYVEFLRHAIDEKQQLLLDGSNGIGLILRNTDKIPGLPSWAVDYSYKDIEGRFGGYTIGAGSGVPCTIRNALDPMILSTQGAFFDTVASFVRLHIAGGRRSGWVRAWDFVGRSFFGINHLQGNNSSGDAYDIISLWEFVVAHSERVHPSGIPLVQAFFRLFANYVSNDIGLSRISEISARAMVREDFYRNAAGFLSWVASIAKAKNYQHPKFKAFCESIGTETSIVSGILSLYNPAVAGFLATMGIVDHLYALCQRIGGPFNLVGIPQQELLVGFWGSHASECEELSWKDAEGREDYLSRMQFYVTMLGVLEQKAVFITRLGHVGYGPDGILEGDKVSILPGCQYPILVRKKGKAYQVVGACVVYGIMDGEWTNKLKSGELKLRDIRLI